MVLASGQGLFNIIVISWKIKLPYEDVRIESSVFLKSSLYIVRITKKEEGGKRGNIHF